MHCWSHAPRLIFNGEWDVDGNISFSWPSSLGRHDGQEQGTGSIPSPVLCRRISGGDSDVLRRTAGVFIGYRHHTCAHGTDNSRISAQLGRGFYRVYTCAHGTNNSRISAQLVFLFPPTTGGVSCCFGVTEYFTASKTLKFCSKFKTLIRIEKSKTINGS